MLKNEKSDPKYTATIKAFLFGDQTVRLCMPDESKVNEAYAIQKNADAAAPPPYWARLWPSAVAMSRFVVRHFKIIKSKNILELGAGLGLPSLVAAPFARTVVCTDNNKEAICFIQESAHINGLKNVKAAVMDWNDLPLYPEVDVLLLSDVAYDPAAFENLFALIQNFLQKGSTVILSTPQRLLSKPFATQLLPFCIYTDAEDVDGVLISIFVLKRNND